MPVAALIVVRPRIEVKPIKGDSLRAYRDRGEERTNVAIEAIFVHAQIRRGVAQPDEARQQPGLVGKEAQLLWERTSWEEVFDHRRPYELVVPVVQRQVVTCGELSLTVAKTSACVSR